MSVVLVSSAANDSEDRVSLLDLPDDTILCILSYMDYTDLCRLGCLNCRLNKLVKYGGLWKRLCNTIWLDSLQVYSDVSWYDNFKHWFADWSRYVKCYVDIKTAWNTLEDFTKKYCPEIYAYLKDPVTESELDQCERDMGCKLPIDLRCSFRIHNGQINELKGLMGSVELGTYHYSRTELLLDLKSAIAGFNSAESGCLFPLTFCPFHGTSQYMVLKSQHSMVSGTVIYPCEDPAALYKDYFISAGTFTEWLCSFAKKLQQNKYRARDGVIYRYYHDDNCVAVTNHIKVTVATCMMPELSSINPPKYIFAYHITMVMDEQAPSSDSCQLQHRHWEVVDGQGRIEIVDGEGVVGAFPILRPGTSYSWVSITHFATPTGYMSGYFTMEKLNSGEMFDVTCPMFTMKSLEISTSKEIQCED
ncbi:F-box only protein 3-like [Saccoglossus kowalevskii]|uniref:F-box only protein 3-like n=1 Tax=Saccoglossus kowalevskii TaxID=10224 RepID=A0ABM0GSB9_SACKO|nr:PREDICTED: F-box only protein 3-like [Saccoglossus kowalevskii]